MAEDSPVEEEEDQPPCSMSSGDGEEICQVPQTPDGARVEDASSGQIVQPTAPPMADVSTLAHVDLDVVSGFDTALTLATEPFNFLHVGDLGTASFCYPVTTAEIERHHVTSGRPSISINTAQPSLPPLPSNQHNVADIDIAEAPRVWQPASGPNAGDYDLHPFNLDIDLGQTPLEVWFQNSDNVTLHLPIITREPPGQSPKNILDDEGFDSIANDVSVRLGLPNPHKAPFTFREMQQFINSYIESFHPHQPFIHLPSVSFTKTPCPLILAMGSIGALYRLQRRRGYELYKLASQIVSKASMMVASLLLTCEYISSSSHDKADAGTHEPLWLLQTRLLLAMFGSFSDRVDIAAETFHKMGHMMLVRPSALARGWSTHQTNVHCL
jgi:hypothetical protein